MAGFIQFIRTDTVLFSSNTLSHIREGVNLNGASRVTIENNRFDDFQPADGDHADAVQLFTSNLTLPHDLASHSIVIKGNLILAGDKAQGVFSRDEIGMHESDKGYRSVEITDNVIVGAVWHGITADHIEGLEIRDNLLFRTPQGVSDNRIMVKGGTGSVVRNLASAYLLSAGVTARMNRQQGTRGPSAQKAIAAWEQRNVSRH
jgi:hypothetical protein